MEHGLTSFTPEQLLAKTSWMKRLALSLVHDDAAADDIVQETWLKAVERPLITSPPPGWLRAVIENLAYRRQRAERRRRGRELAAAQPELLPQAPDQILERVELQHRIVEIVLQLEEPYRSTILLRFFEELTPKAIARRQRVPESTVRSRLTRALDQLRKRLDRSHGSRAAWLTVLPLPTLETVDLYAASAGASALVTTPVATSPPLYCLFLGVLSMKKAAIFSACVLALLTGLSLPQFLGTSQTAKLITEREEPAVAELRHSLPPADVRVGASSVSAEPASTVPASQADPPNTNNSSIVLEIRDARTDRPIPGARVDCLLLPMFSKTIVLNDFLRDREPLVSNDDGIAVWESPPVGKEVLTLIEHEAYSPLCHSPVRAGERHKLFLSAGGTLSVLVLRSNGVPVPGAAVILEDRNTVERFVSQDGRLQLSPLREGSWLVTATHPLFGTAEASVEIRTEEVCQVQLELKPGRILEGRLVDAGTKMGLAGIEVRFKSGHSHTVSDPDGRFVLHGKEKLEVLCYLGEGYEGEREAWLAEESPTKSQFEVERNTTVHVLVLREDGEPLANAEVEVFGQGLGCTPICKRTDEEGRLRIGGHFTDMSNQMFFYGRGPDGYYGMAWGTVKVPSLFPRSLESLNLLPDEMKSLVPATAFQPPPEENVVQLRHPGSIHGEVLDGQGSPVADASVKILHLNLCGFLSSAKTGVDGSFRLTTIPAYKYLLACSKEGYRTEHLQVALDSDETAVRIVLGLETGRRFILEFLDATALRPIPGLPVSSGIGRPYFDVLESSHTDEAGRVYTNPLPSGDLHITIEKGFYNEKLEVDLDRSSVAREGDYRICRFYLTKTERSDGYKLSVVDAAGNPLSGIHGILVVVQGPPAPDEVPTLSAPLAFRSEQTDFAGEAFLPAVWVDQGLSKAKLEGGELYFILNSDKLPELLKKHYWNPAYESKGFILRDSWSLPPSLTLSPMR
jgi:RNA polymerase sigma-70 factor (ECF subfamily)